MEEEEEEEEEDKKDEEDEELPYTHIIYTLRVSAFHLEIGDTLYTRYLPKDLSVLLL